MSKLVIIFPGLGYTTDKPLLYYGVKLAGEVGYRECKKLSYKSDIQAGNNPKEWERLCQDLYRQAELQLSEIDWGLYDDILFISKSIGTIIAAKYAYENNIKNVRHVLYTPLEETYIYPPKEAIAFVGTKDMMYDKVVELSGNAGIPLFVFDDCNHSLETDNVIHNIEIINKIMIKTKEFISKVN